MTNTKPKEIKNAIKPVEKTVAPVERDDIRHRIRKLMREQLDALPQTTREAIVDEMRQRANLGMPDSRVVNRTENKTFEITPLRHLWAVYTRETGNNTVNWVILTKTKPDGTKVCAELHNTQTSKGRCRENARVQSLIKECGAIDHDLHVSTSTATDEDEYHRY